MGMTYHTAWPVPGRMRTKEFAKKNKLGAAFPSKEKFLWLQDDWDFQDFPPLGNS
jgi:hypothetical protein